MTKKLDGGKTKAENIVNVIVEKVKEPKAKLVKVIVEKPKVTAKVFTKVVQDALEGKPKMDLNGLVKRANPDTPKVKKDDRQATRLEFVRTNSATILKAWAGLKGKKSGAALNRALPKLHNKFVDEVLMLHDLRKSGEKCVIEAVAEDAPLLKDMVQCQKVKAKAKTNGHKAARLANDILGDMKKSPIVKDGGYTDEG